MTNNRTQYDNQMRENYNPLRENYHTPPWPVSRSSTDMKMQKKWCPHCKNPQQHSYVEGFAPLTGFRSKFDMKLQQKWCPKCTNGPSPGPKPYGPHPRPHPRPHPQPYGRENYASTVDDPDNHWSYTYRPYQA